MKKMAHKEPLVRWPDDSYSFETPPLTWIEALRLLAGFIVLTAFIVMVIFVMSIGTPA